MLFSSPIFLFAFLPVFLGLYLALPNVRLRNGLLLAGSLLFYAWGETVYVLILVASIAFNYGFGLWIEHLRGRLAVGRILALAVSLNLLLLGVFKYANFLTENLNIVLGMLGVSPILLAPIHLPIGISFFTFQAITYVVDIHRGQASAQKNPLRVGLYIALFPQLIAGPIVRYRQIAEQLQSRTSRLEEVAEGVRRFIVGLAKNARLDALGAPWPDQAASGFATSGDKQRLFGEFTYAAGTWRRERRVIARIEHGPKGANPRYIVTNLEGNGRELYEKLYCQRGDMENLIKEQQLDLFADRTSCHAWWPNQLRLLLASLAYVLMAAIRRLALAGTEMARAQCGTIRLKLLKIGAVITRNTRRLRFHLSSACPDQALFRLADARLEPG